MRKTLATLAVTAAAFAVPMLGTGTAYAADTNASADATTVTQIVDSALGGGCLSTFVNQVEATPLGTPVVISGLTVTIYGGTAVLYAYTQEGNVVALNNCLV